MKFIDINREFTAAANSYMAQGYYINAGTMGGSQGEVAHIDLTNGTEIIRVLLTTFNNYLGTEGVELIVGRVKDDIKPNQEDRWNTVWNERLEVISNKKFYRLNNRAQDGFYGTEEEANAAEEKRFDRYKSRRSNDSALDVTTKAAPMVKKYIHEKFGVRRVKMDDIKVVKVPMTEIAAEHENPKGANIVMMGAMAANSDLFTEDDLERLTNEFFEKKGKINPKNSLCFRAGTQIH